MNSFSKTHLFSLMRQTAEVVDAYIMEELSSISLNEHVASEAIMHLPAIRARPNGRGARPKLRATFIRLVFELLSEDDWQKVVPVAAAGELLAISSYVVDDFLDHQEMRDGERTTWVVYGSAEAVMAAQLQREVAERVLLRLAMPEQRLVRLAQLLNEIFYQCYLGQWMDSKMTKPCPIEDYIKRCEKIAGHFHAGLAMMAASFAGAPDDIVEKIGKFGFWHGIALQIRNDLVDYMPSTITASAGAHALERVPFEDFRNAKWTMPLLHAYERAGPSDRERLELLTKEEAFSENDVHWLTNLLYSTGAYEAALRLITSYKERARESLMEFSQSQASKPLLVLLDTVENGRSYVQKLAMALR